MSIALGLGHKIVHIISTPFPYFYYFHISIYCIFFISYSRPEEKGREQYFRICKVLSLFTRVCTTDNLLSPTIMFIMFWDFLMVEQIFISPQVKPSVIIGNKLVYTSCFTSCQTT